MIDLGSYLSQLNSTEVSLGTLIDFVNNEVYNGTSELDALVLILQTALQNSDVVLFDQEFTGTLFSCMFLHKLIHRVSYRWNRRSRGQVSAGPWQRRHYGKALL